MSRDTQFAGFASLLFDDLPWEDINIDMERKGWEDRWLLYIAQSAYDFACHVCEETIGGGTPEKVINGISDMIAWKETH